MGPVVNFKEGIWSRTSASERRDHDDKSAGSDFVINEILGFIHLLAWDNELELINRHALFVLDTFLKHLDCVVFLIVDTEFAIGNGLDFQIGHWYWTIYKLLWFLDCTRNINTQDSNNLRSAMVLTAYFLASNRVEGINIDALISDEEKNMITQQVQQHPVFLSSFIWSRCTPPSPFWLSWIWGSRLSLLLSSWLMNSCLAT